MVKLNSLIQSRKVQIIWLLVVVPILAFLSLRHSLNLSLWGDDFEFIWRLLYHPQELYNGNYLAYGTSHLCMFFLYSLFGLNPFPYYLSSLILKVLAAISIYFFVRAISGSRLAGMVASTLFAVSYVGLMSTDWVFNMNTYMGIILVSFFVYFFCQSRTKGKQYLYFIALVFFTLSIAVVPMRMHGIFIVILVDFLWFLRRRTSKTFKLFLFRQLPLIGILYFLGRLGFYSGWIRYVFQTSFEIAKGYLGQGRFDLLLNPIVTLGNIVFPDRILSWLWNQWPVRGLVNLVIFILLIALGRRLFRIKKKFSWILTVITIFWVFFVWFISRLQDTYFFNRYGISLLIGGFFLITVVGLYLYYRKSNAKLTDAILFSSTWIVAFYLVPWIKQEYNIIPSFHRYLTLSFVGYSLFIGSLTALFFQNRVASSKAKSLLAIFVVGTILVNFVASNEFLKEQAEYRGIDVSTKIRKSLADQVPEIKDLSLFYFTTSDATDKRLHGIITFGFEYYIGLLYEIHDGAKLPLALISFDELASLALLDKGWERHRPRIKPHNINFDRIYSFRLEGDELIDTKRETIQRLRVLQPGGIRE